MITTITSDSLVTAITSTEQLTLTALSTPGPQGPPGSAGDGTYFQVSNRFSELDDSQKKTEARQNLELQYIDCGTFN